MTKIYLSKKKFFFLFITALQFPIKKKPEKNIAYFRLILIEFIAKIASLLTSFTDECKLINIRINTMVHEDEKYW